MHSSAEHEEQVEENLREGAHITLCELRVGEPSDACVARALSVLEHVLIFEGIIDDDVAGDGAYVVREVLCKGSNVVRRSGVSAVSCAGWMPMLAGSSGVRGVV